MVGEFPELQGIVGEIYALKQGETPEVAQAIREHYMPTSADGELPSSVPGALLAVADKLDTFLSFTAAGMLPTGSNDPYALRRQVMGLVQILAAFDWNIEIEDFTKLLLGLDYAEFLSGKEEEVEEFILSFIRERVAQRIATITKRHDIIVVSDELYEELTYTGKPHVSVVEIEGMRDRTILIGGFSKAFAMTGWRLGYALAPEPIMEQMYKIHQFAIMSAPTLSQYAGVDALRNSEEDIVEMRESYNQRRRYLVKRFKDLGIPCFEPFGAFYIFPNISQFGLSSEEFAMRLVEEERLAVVPGTAFGESGEGFLRISYAYSIEDLKTALDRIEHFITKLRNEK